MEGAAGAHRRDLRRGGRSTGAPRAGEQRWWPTRSTWSPRTPTPARSDGSAEAVDILWIRRAPHRNGAIGPIRPRDVAAIGEMVDALVRGEAKLDPALGFVRALRTARATTRVRFEDVAGDGTMVLTVEATDRPEIFGVLEPSVDEAERDRAATVTAG